MTIDDVDKIAIEVAHTVGKVQDIPFERWVKEVVIANRATILKQQFDRDGRFPSGSEDSVTVPMKQVEAIECGADEITCTVYRTEQKIPRPIRKNRTPVPFSFAGNAKQAVSFIFVKPEEVRPFIEGNRFIKDKPLYAYYNDYIFTFNHVGGKITIREAFADPRELRNLLDCDKKPCKSAIEIDEDMKRVIKMMIFEELRQFNKIPEDTSIKINEKV